MAGEIGTLDPDQGAAPWLMLIPAKKNGRKPGPLSGVPGVVPQASTAMAPAPMQGGIDMRKRTFDALLVVAGLALAAILLVAGGLLTWGHVFVSNQVHDQLAAQKIYF